MPSDKFRTLLREEAVKLMTGGRSDASTGCSGQLHEETDSKTFNILIGRRITWLIRSESIGVVIPQPRGLE